MFTEILARNSTKIYQKNLLKTDNSIPTYLDIFVWYCNIWSSTSFMDILPRKMEATVK